MPSTSQENQGLSSLPAQALAACAHPHKAHSDSHRMRYHSEPAHLEQAGHLLAVTCGTCRPVSAWRVAGWRMDVDSCVRESRDMTKGMLSTSDKAHCVTVARLDFVGLAATRARRAAVLMHAPSPGAPRPRFVHPLSPASTRPPLQSARSCDALLEDRYEDLR